MYQKTSGKIRMEEKQEKKRRYEIGEQKCKIRKEKEMYI